MDDLAQTPMTMSVLEVLKTFPTQWKALLAVLGTIDPSDSKLITFDTENEEPWMTSTISFQILISIQNLVVYRCILDEVASMCIIVYLSMEKAWIPNSATILYYSTGL